MYTIILKQQEFDNPVLKKLLPRCGIPACGGLLRPHVVWFGESLESHILGKVEGWRGYWIVFVCLIRYTFLEIGLKTPGL